MAIDFESYRAYLKWLHTSVALPVFIMSILFLMSSFGLHDQPNAAVANFGSGDALLVAFFMLISAVADLDQAMGSRLQDGALAELRENASTLAMLFLLIFAVMKWVSLSPVAAKNGVDFTPALVRISLGCLLLAVLTSIRIKRKVMYLTVR